MNAVEIEEAVSLMAEQPFDPVEFPYQFLEAFGNKETTIKRLRTGNNNKSDIDGGVLQQNNIHIAVCEAGKVSDTLKSLKESPATANAKAKFILATDGVDFQAEELSAGETIVCEFSRFHNHFGFFLPLAGISTVKQIRENAFDIKATSRLNKLYIELLRHNPDWATAERRHDMNHFLARLIFCFFAEDTDIFHGDKLFTATVQQMSASDASDTHEIISEVFRAMDIKMADRQAEAVKNWANTFPYVNGELFSGSTEVPCFTKIARSYLIHVGNLDWKKINPDIFGSMIQAVADEDERGALGMHYTSVPNILKVLNPLFLDELRAELDGAGKHKDKLIALRDRISRIRVFDPACGSGNFLVIAYKELRKIEHEINERLGEADRVTEIPLTNYRGIELRDFSAEIARLALIIAEYQCDVVYRGQQLALAEFLPLDVKNWIYKGNALRVEWLSICPPTGTGVKHFQENLFSLTDQAEMDYKNEGGETYICGNPPYLGSQWQSNEQKADLEAIFKGKTTSWKSLDYVAGWFMKAAEYGRHTNAASAFVSTNSICQGRQVATLWPLIFRTGNEIQFAHTNFKWTNLASHNAAVIVNVIGISRNRDKSKKLYGLDRHGNTMLKECNHINAYLTPADEVIVQPTSKPIFSLPEMNFGNMPNDSGHLLMTKSEASEALKDYNVPVKFIRPLYGSQEFIRGISRYCIWVHESENDDASESLWLLNRFELNRKSRLESQRKTTKSLAKYPYRFGEVRQLGSETVIIIPKVSSENRDYIPVGLLPQGSIITDLSFGIFNPELWNLSLIASKLHLVWITTVCGKMKTDLRYSNTMGWNTFPVPTLTEKNRADLTRCAEEILIARERHFPATIADLYDPDKMPADLRQAHERNDEVLERIYIGRRFKNDTERLEKLFELYTQMTANNKTA
ncbi:class I SAM-dependent DNA methyltransferase [Fulvivirga sediminis]|uniref:site-specific DNA-methyltransferase (adenine-specific) n=1 Tax=Fulvivirga sediminis TaxID=2803949 RepID=A0A937FAA4_9BACT|nr:class I SAM-dependent DNA methyltransferase [Fulvivirga sediminis]MBL3658580.1 class I SAM-dependent DNA methyltransferase [Fulvivirga sediminis]